MSLFACRTPDTYLSRPTETKITAIDRWRHKGASRAKLHRRIAISEQMLVRTRRPAEGSDYP